MARGALLLFHEICSRGRGFQPRWSRLESRSHKKMAV